MRRIAYLLLLVGLALIAIGGFQYVQPWFLPTPPTAAGPGPSAAGTQPWAAPLSRPGLPNFHRVSENLYRGAQPTTEGFQELADMGIKTVVNLRALHSDEDDLGGAPLDCEHIRFNPLNPSDDEVVSFLKIVTDKSRGPVFVHCRHGADRTGTMCALYRVLVEGWSNDEALREMTEGPFGFHGVWANLKEYIEKLDVDRIRQEVGLTGQPASSYSDGSSSGSGQ